MTYIRQSELAFIDKQFPNGWTLKNNDQTKA